MGTVVSTVKSPIFEGRALLLVDLLEPDGREAGGYLIAVDTVGAGAGETVLVLDEGTSARQIVGAAGRAAADGDRGDRGRGGGAGGDAMPRRSARPAPGAPKGIRRGTDRAGAGRPTHRRTIRAPARYPSRHHHGGTMADTTTAGDVVPAQTREELLAQHAEARRRRNAPRSAATSGRPPAARSAASRSRSPASSGRWTRRGSRRGREEPGDRDPPVPLLGADRHGPGWLERRSCCRAADGRGGPGAQPELRAAQRVQHPARVPARVRIQGRGHRVRPRHDPHRPRRLPGAVGDPPPAPGPPARGRA